MVDSLKVMTFNVRCEWPGDEANAWKVRSQNCLQVVEEHSPDILCLQEGQAAHWQDFSTRLARYMGERGATYNNNEPFAYTSILWRKDRFELKQAGHFWLSETPEEHSGAWGTDCVRSASWVRLSADMAEVVVLNTHLDHVSEEARQKGTKLIAERMDGQGVPVLVAGDFNCEPGSSAHRVLLAAGYRDSFLESGKQDGQEEFTWHDLQGTRQPHASRIDWIMLRSAEGELKAVACDIIRDSFEGRYPSDHFPVVAEFG